MSWFNIFKTKSIPKSEERATTRLSLKDELLDRVGEEIEAKKQEKIRRMAERKEDEIKRLKYRIKNAMMEGETSITYLPNREEMPLDTDLTLETCYEVLTGFNLEYDETNRILYIRW